MPFSGILIAGGEVAVGSWLFLDNNTGTRYKGVVYAATGTTVAFQPAGGTFLGLNPNIGMASGDSLGIKIAYESS